MQQAGLTCRALAIFEQNKPMPSTHAAIWLVTGLLSLTYDLRHILSQTFLPEVSLAHVLTK